MADPHEQFAALFERLRALFSPHEPAAVLLRDEPTAYSLGTHEVRAKDGYRTWFGGVEIRKNYVSAHLMPVYVHPELLDGVSPALRKRMQGKACFNFKTVDEALLNELAALVRRGAERMLGERQAEAPQ